MRAPTDVLLVMDLTIQRMGDISSLRCRGDGYTQVVEIWKRDIWQARSAMVELIEDLYHIRRCGRALRVSGPDPMDLRGLSDALQEAVDTAHKALYRVGGAA